MRHRARRDEAAAHGEAVVGAAVIDEDDLVAARHVERLERVDQLADAARAVIDRDDDAAARHRAFFRHGLTALARIEPPNGNRMPAAASLRSRREAGGE